MHMMGGHTRDTVSSVVGPMLIHLYRSTDWLTSRMRSANSE